MASRVPRWSSGTSSRPFHGAEFWCPVDHDHETQPLARLGEEGSETMERADRDRYVANLQAEIDGSALYRALADIEVGSELATVYSRMAEAEERHANIW